MMFTEIRNPSSSEAQHAHISATSNTFIRTMLTVNWVQYDYTLPRSYSLLWNVTQKEDPTAPP